MSLPYTTAEALRTGVSHWRGSPRRYRTPPSWATEPAWAMVACTQVKPLVTSRLAAWISITQMAVFTAELVRVKVLVEGTAAVNWPMVLKSVPTLVQAWGC